MSEKYIFLCIVWIVCAIPISVACAKTKSVWPMGGFIIPIALTAEVI